MGERTSAGRLVALRRALLPDYLLNDVVATTLGGDGAGPVESGPEPVRPGCWRFRIADRDGPLCQLQVIVGRHYSDRFPWPLDGSSGVVTRLWTRPEARGRGLAARLLADAAAGMGPMGIDTLYAMVWWRNAASLRTFAKAGWFRAAKHLTVAVPGRADPLDLVWRTPEFRRLAGARRAQPWGAAAPALLPIR